MARLNQNTFFKYFSIVLVIFSIAAEAKLSGCNFKNLGDDPTLLVTQYGMIQGACNDVVILDTDNSTKAESIISWLSVPYVQPPINEYRLKKPQPVQSWKNIRNGTILPNSCMQPFFPGFQLPSISEDCLYLNIYAPASLFTGKSSKSNTLPVFMWIHGGRFELGSGSQFDPSVMVGLTNIIVVTINYRLGPFGFLHMSNTDISGNQGFLDQHMALKWIYENAASFRGDPDRITIGGQSAGSFSTSYHLIYPPSWPYFRNAIMESGTVLYSTMNFLPLDEASRRANDIFTLLGCGNNTVPQSQILECVQKLDATTLLNVANNYYQNVLLSGSTYARELTPLIRLVEDGTEFTESTKESFVNGDYKKCNIIVGSTLNEGGFMVALSGFFGPKLDNNIFLNQTSFREFLELWYVYFPTYPNKSTESFLDELTYEYTKNVTDPANTNYLSYLIQIIGEELFNCPGIDLANIYSNVSNVYAYSFNQLKSTHAFPEIFGVVHADELSFIFGDPLSQQQSQLYTYDERVLSKQMIQYWANFVRNNDPNINNSSPKLNTSPYWPPFLETNSPNIPIHEYLVFKANQTAPSNDLSYRHCEYWRKYNTYPN